jgi:hypothetical protein
MTATNANPLTKKQLFGILESCWGLVLNGDSTIWDRSTQSYMDREDDGTFELYNDHVRAYQRFKVDSAQSVADGELLQLEDIDGKTYRFIVLFNQNIEDLR